MKLRSGKCLSSAVSNVASTTRSGLKKSASEVYKKSVVGKGRNKDFNSTSESSTVSASSDSSDEKSSLPPKHTARKRSSKVVPLKKCNIRGLGNSRKISDTQTSSSHSSVENKAVVSLSDDLKGLNISAAENSASCAPRTILVSEEVKQHSTFLKNSRCENISPPKQTGVLPLCNPSPPECHSKSLDTTVNAYSKHFPNVINSINDVNELSEKSPYKTGGKVLCVEQQHFSQDTAENIARNKIFKPNLQLKSLQHISKEKKLQCTNTAGTVKCATSIKTLVTKTLSGNSCEVIPVIYIDSSSSSEDDGCDGSNANTNVEIKVDAADTECKSDGAFKLVGNAGSNRNVFELGKVGEHSVSNNTSKSHSPEIKASDVSEAAANNVSKTKEIVSDQIVDVTHECVPTENDCDLTRSKGFISASCINGTINTRQAQPSSVLGQPQKSNTHHHTGQYHQSSQEFPRSDKTTAHSSYQNCENKSRWEATSEGRGSHWSGQFRNARRSRRRKSRQWRWRSPQPNAYFDSPRQQVPPSTTGSYTMNIPPLLQDYNRLGDALYRGTVVGQTQHYHEQQARVPAAQLSGPPSASSLRPDTLTGMQNPIGVFGGNVYLPSSQPIRRQGLRPIVIDGSNVAMGHGGNCHFSYRGLQICVDYFVRRGHKVIAFLPQHRKCGLAVKDRLVLQQLEKGGHVVFTPSRKVDNRLVVPYDDWYIVQCAAVLEGIIVSNDNYRDLLFEDSQVTKTIKERLLMFTWVDNLLMFPKDPLGRGGPTLDQFLSFPIS